MLVKPLSYDPAHKLMLFESAYGRFRARPHDISSEPVEVFSTHLMRIRSQP